MKVKILIMYLKIKPQRDEITLPELKLLLPGSYYANQLLGLKKKVSVYAQKTIEKLIVAFFGHTVSIQKAIACTYFLSFFLYYPCKTCAASPESMINGCFY